MPIVNSVYKVGHSQVDGRKYVIETHTDDANDVLVIEYLAEPNTDYATVMSNRVSVLNTIRAEQEAEQVIGYGSITS